MVISLCLVVGYSLMKHRVFKFFPYPVYLGGGVAEVPDMLSWKLNSSVSILSNELFSVGEGYELTRMILRLAI